jgi:hypothetical protein
VRPYRWREPEHGFAALDGDEPCSLGLGFGPLGVGFGRPFGPDDGPSTSGSDLHAGSREYVPWCERPLENAHALSHPTPLLFSSHREPQ